MKVKRIKQMWFAGWRIAARLWLFYFVGLVLWLPCGLLLQAAKALESKLLSGVLCVLFLVFVFPCSLYLTAKWRNEFRDEIEDVKATHSK